MAHQWREDAAIPLNIRRPLGEWVDATAEALGEDCLAIVLTGPLTRGDEAFAHATPVDLVVVLNDVDVVKLDQMAEVTRSVQRKLEVAPLVLCRADLERSTDVFPTRFLSVQQHHLLLHGTDLLTQLPIARDHLRLRCEQELKDLVLTLRELYLRRAHQLQGLLGTIAEANVRFVDTLESVLRLTPGEQPARRADIAEQAAKILGFDLEVVKSWLAVARGDFTPGRDQARDMVQGLLKAVRTAADAVDAMDQRDLI